MNRGSPSLGVKREPQEPVHLSVGQVCVGRARQTPEVSGGHIPEGPRAAPARPRKLAQTPAGPSERAEGGEGAPARAPG